MFEDLEDILYLYISKDGWLPCCQSIVKSFADKAENVW